MTDATFTRVSYLPAREKECTGGSSLHVPELPVALLASVLIHLAAMLLLAHAGHSRLHASSAPAELTVIIAQPEARSQPVAQQPPLAEAMPKAPLRHSTEPSPHPAPPVPAVLPQERYYRTSELDVIPQVRPDFELYPEDMQRFKQGGKLVISLWINEEGRVEKTEVVKSDLPEAFAEVAMRRFMQANFSPGRKDHLAVKSRVEAVLAFPAHDI